MRTGERGQALIETAVTMPVLITLLIGFLAAGVAAQGYVDLNTAVYLAAASNVTAFADEPDQAKAFASDTYTHTVAHDTLLAPQGPIDCGLPPNDYAAGGRITCQASAKLELSRTPLAIVIPFDPVITATAQAVRSPYRSQAP